MNFKSAFLILAAAIPVLAPQVSFAQNSCYDLWYARNEIYQRKGYCFQTRLARQTFGNTNCYTRAPQFTRAEQLRIESIRREERRRGCNVN